MAIFAIFEHSGNIVPVTSQCTIKTRVNLLFMSWNSFLKKVVMKGNIPRRAHFPSPFHVSLIIWVCPHLSLPALALPYQSLFYIHFIKAASWQKKKRKKKSTKPQQRLGFDFLHRSKPNGGVLFSCLKQSTLILLPWRALVEVRSFVPLPDQMPSYEVETCQPQALMYKQIS